MLESRRHWARCSRSGGWWWLSPTEPVARSVESLGAFRWLRGTRWEGGSQAHANNACSSPTIPPRCSWSSAADGASDVDSAACARQALYLFERVLHGVLLEALRCEAEGGGGGGGAASTQQPLTAAQRDRVVEAALGDEEQQLGLVNACIEVLGEGRWCNICCTRALFGQHSTNRRLVPFPSQSINLLLHPRWSTFAICETRRAPSPGPRCSWAACTTRWSCGRCGAADDGRPLGQRRRLVALLSC